MRELVCIALGVFLGFCWANHNHGKDVTLPDLSSIPGLGSDDAGTPKEVHPAFPEHVKDLKHKAHTISL